jgi:hypothetical protein
MGLDMYAYSVKADEALTPFEMAPEAQTKEIHYWRKHHDLHGWMERLWRKKLLEVKHMDALGGNFNCRPVALTLSDLDELEMAITNDALPETTGFFFGHNPPNEDSKEEDLTFIARAREEVNRGNVVYYNSWW